MIPRPSKNYFLIKIERTAQKVRKDCIGSLVLHTSHNFMQRNMQYGEIVGIGEKAHEYFPEAKIGHILLTHHYVEQASDHEAKESHLIHQDADYNYYVVAAFPHNGKGYETYGVWTGATFIPIKDFIFLEVEPPIANNLSPDDYINQAIEQADNGLFVFKEWNESREETTAKMKTIKQEIHNISKGKNSHTVRHEIMRKQEELEAMSAKINTDTYNPYTIIAINPETNEWFDNLATPGSTIYTLNKASQTTVEFKGKEYRMVPVKYIGFLINKAS